MDGARLDAADGALLEAMDGALVEAVERVSESTAQVPFADFTCFNAGFLRSCCAIMARVKGFFWSLNGASTDLEFEGAIFGNWQGIVKAGMNE